MVPSYKWPADAVERRPIGSLIPYARNSRTHSDAQIAQIAASIREWGWTVPVLVDEGGTIIAGHARVRAAQSLQLDQVPVMVAAGWNEAKKRAYIIADNKLAENAGWDDAMLAAEFAALNGDGFDLDLLGFSDAELAEIDRQAGIAAGLTDPDDAPPIPAVVTSVPGDLWRLGAHRLICGDSTSADVVVTLLGDARPMLMVTDPPYGVEYDPAWRERSGLGSGGNAIGKVLNDERADWREAWSLFPGHVAYIWHGALQTPIVSASLEACSFKLRAQIVWVKTRPVISRGDYHWQHETAYYAHKDGVDDNWRFVPEHEVSLYAVRDKGTGHWVGDRKQSTVWFIEHLKSDTGHSTQKPVECMRRPITNNSAPGQAVYEPFSGSGTTIIAAEQTGRVCYAIELDPSYVDVAVMRWQDFTGKTATLDSDGRTFDAVKAARA
jgi:DNA modification methylase